MTSTKTNDLLSKRRRFQPPITTFFSATFDPNSCPSHLSHNHYSATTHSPTPIVPAKVQASLLSVGMRVRKSIAEGYKTHQAMLEETKLSYQSKDAHTPKTMTTPIYSASRSELAPFCGIAKSGDSIHPFSHPQPNLNFSADYDDADAFSLPPSSQESTDSSYEYQGQPAQKRSYNFDDDEDEDEDESLDYESSQRVAYIPGTTWQDQLRLNPITPPMAGRTILSPRLNQHRRHFIAATQRQREVVVDDFEESAFLRRREDVEMEYEVQMGGV